MTSGEYEIRMEIVSSVEIPVGVSHSQDQGRETCDWKRQDLYELVRKDDLTSESTLNHLRADMFCCSFEPALQNFETTLRKEVA
ncbi:hypothetical protein TNIN_65421 [Trichonephila inaurata madagascariensis]|uniref:Uncharacterized protein n=1 Tax=Trichonephila inaurata madagascariensis TaxID=2747483 RepID=A0A8X6Y0K3_9ARAC|nr:hypothetical protein TNIN_65421 [Trichonephila inaurata madagascariensis]